MTAFERPEVRAVARLLPPLLRRHVRPLDRSAEPVAAPPRGRCDELGDPRPDQADVACLARLRDCHLHGVCTTGVQVAGQSGPVACCATCNEHTDLPPESKLVGSTRHLLYFVYPVAANSVWQANVDQLLERIDLFNGRRVCAIAYRSGLVHPKPEGRQRPAHRVDPPELVRERLSGHGFEFLEFRDDPMIGTLGEVVAFEPLWSRVADQVGPGDVTWYGHAKGVSRPVNPGVSVHPWASLLYAANLDYWPVVADLLTRHPVVGAMKTLGRATAYSGGWHYSGTYFWFRNADVFARDWRRIDRVFGGVESWPGVQFTAEEAGCVFWQESIRRCVTGYDFPRLREALAEFVRWGEGNAAHRRPGASLTPWLDRHGYQ